MRTRAGLLFLAVPVFAAPNASASTFTFGFQSITLNDPIDSLIGESQLFVDVSNGGPSVTFAFRNEGPEASVISEIYFDDGTLLGISSITDDPPAVDFVQDASPPDLPGGQTLDPPFDVTEGFLAEAVPAPPHTGVGPGETVSITFDLMDGGTLQDVLAELGDGSLRIGIHVIAFESGGSESFVHIPEPATLALLGAGVVGLILRRRRRPPRFK